MQEQENKEQVLSTIYFQYVMIGIGHYLWVCACNKIGDKCRAQANDKDSKRLNYSH